ncbi:TnsD family Tn7-like transposition protein [Paraburkholderia sp. BL10I2N1]|uniref:TnsD family Tn7-like transposition protein n=1 Tax=Paraburkholderia sp. BL10I2N1 TaxID=1938796 RepID=UPI00105F4F59|nr:TnsD family Tn7-like transposition protein [Paraburkholderia sp. BL10I2N1]TDN64020.1 TniQ protein [Paraburkholderia sp. BL10I2N1]
MAIALLPLKEGETLGGNFGRYAELADLKLVHNFKRSLFGYASRRLTRLPGGIGYLAEQTRDYWNLKAEVIINEHTEFRYATMMASSPTREKILRGMLEHPKNTEFVPRIIRLNGERTVALRYCKECLVEWIEKQEIPYWKIDHQLAGVYCCVRHSSILKSVNKIFPRGTFDPTVMHLISASDEQVLQRTAASEKHAIDDIAKRSVQQRAEGGPCKPAEAFLSFILEAGFLRENSKIKKHALISSWLDYFGREYCHMTGMTAERISSWLSSLRERAPVFECRHPFMFIAGQSFLEHHVELPGSYLPRIRCKASTSSGESKIVSPILGPPSCTGALHRDGDVLNSSSLKTGGWKLVCTCGISYRMSEATPRVTAQLIPLSYGSRYRDRFHELIATGASAFRAAQALRLGRTTASRWAGRKDVENIKLLPQSEVRRLRVTWRRLVENASPERRITFAAETDPAVYAALLKNDRDWLRSFNRRHRSHRPCILYEPTSVEIREAWRRLMLIEPPIMATQSAILDRTGFRRVRTPSRSFSAVLAEVVECRPAYCERVVSWLATMASKRQLGDCDEAIYMAGLRRRSFTREQQERIREIERMGSAEVPPLANVHWEDNHSI